MKKRLLTQSGETRFENCIGNTGRSKRGGRVGRPPHAAPGFLLSALKCPVPPAFCGFLPTWAPIHSISVNLARNLPMIQNIIKPNSHVLVATPTTTSSWLKLLNLANSMQNATFEAPALHKIWHANIPQNISQARLKTPDACAIPKEHSPDAWMAWLKKRNLQIPMAIL